MHRANNQATEGKVDSLGRRNRRMLDNKTCPHCLKAFRPNKATSIHCSRACQSAAIQAKKVPLTQNRLRELLHYEPETGVFTWLVQRGRTASPGSVAGYVASESRRLIRVDGGHYFAARLAWLYMTGEWPKGEVDHRDTDSLNDRWENLRDVTRVVNQQNMRNPRADSKTGLLGVTRGKRLKGFGARIHVKGKTKWLGTFPTAEEAHAAYVEAKRMFHEGNTL